MAKVFGKNADFAITEEGSTANPALPTDKDDALYDYGQASAGGVPATIQIETFSNEVTLNIESRSEDTTPYGSDFDEFDILTYRWTADINAFYHDAASETERILVVGALDGTGTGTGPFKKRFLLSPAGKPSGSQASATQPKYLGRVAIQSANVNPVRGGVAQIRASLQGDGPLFRDTAA